MAGTQKPVTISEEKMAEISINLKRMEEVEKALSINGYLHRMAARVHSELGDGTNGTVGNVNRRIADLYVLLKQVEENLGKRIDKLDATLNNGMRESVRKNTEFRETREEIEKDFLAKFRSLLWGFLILILMLIGKEFFLPQNPIQIDAKEVAQEVLKQLKEKQ